MGVIAEISGKETDLGVTLCGDVNTVAPVVDIADVCIAEGADGVGGVDGSVAVCGERDRNDFEKTTSDVENDTVRELASIDGCEVASPPPAATPAATPPPPAI